MKTIYINAEGLVSSPYVVDANAPVEVSEEDYKKISTFPFNHNWKYLDGKMILVCLDDEAEIRKRRETECFIYINRGSLWYDTLSEVQKLELKNWYQDWLDAPSTKSIPAKPSWL